MLRLTNQYVVVLDACVLAPMPLADTLLRLAEDPAFYVPRWTRMILDEVHGVLVEKLGRSKDQADRRIRVMNEHFEDALVEGFEGLIPAMRNNEKDRHVLAAAVATGADAIVSCDTSGFPEQSLAPYRIEWLSPDDFLVHQFHLEPDLLHEKIKHQALARGKTVNVQLDALHSSAPTFVRLMRDYITSEQA
jgi:predicted nucleic acid-binding protein